MDDAETVQAEQSPPLGSEPKSPGHGMATSTSSQRSKDLGGAFEAGRSYTDGTRSFIHGEGCIHRDDKARKLTSHCKVSNFV